MFKESKKYISYLINPFEQLLRTKKVLQVNPTAEHTRAEATESKISVYSYSPEKMDVKDLKNVPDCFPYIKSESVTWLNIDGLRKEDVENISNHAGIHYLITEDILSIGQRPKMDEIDGLVF